MPEFFFPFQGNPIQMSGQDSSDTYFELLLSRQLPKEQSSRPCDKPCGGLRARPPPGDKGCVC